MQEHNYALIMAGGVGTRFWPVSRTEYPKQFHDILGVGRTFLQQTFDRIQKFIPTQNIYIVTTLQYKGLCLEQLPELKAEQIICEPTGRNTAACNLYAAMKIHSIDPEANLLVAPSDHLILKEQAFKEKVQLGLAYAKKSGELITLGIEPTRPDTGYGYIQYDKEAEGVISKVKVFTEKPQLEIAKQFIESGEFLWNAGIFIWTAKKIIEAFEKELPEMYHAMNDLKGQLNTPAENEVIALVYPTLQNISVDNGIMEKSHNVSVIPADLGWSDLGTWGSLYAQQEKDENGNLLQVKKLQLHNTTGSLIRCQNNKAVVIDGLENYIVVDTEKSLLICPRNKDQEVKNYVNELKVSKMTDFV